MGEDKPAAQRARSASIGIQPDILLCRTDQFLDQDIKRKIALFCDVDEEAVITAKDVSSIYEVPLVLGAEGLDRILLQRLHLPQTEARMDAWVDLVDRIKHPTDEVTIHVVGKYVGYEDSYKSLNDALYHGGFKHRLRVNIRWVEAEALEQAGGEQLLDGADGILVPGGFGDRGTRGMMRAATLARERGIPTSGSATASSGRRSNTPATSAVSAMPTPLKCSPDTPDKVIYKLRDLLGVDDLGGTMRLGSYSCELKAGSRARDLYGADVIAERHRHRYEFNCLYERTLTETGLEIVGRSHDGKFVEIVELPSHRGTSRCSSTPSSSRSRSRPIRSLPASSTRATSTSSPAGMRRPRRLPGKPREPGADRRRGDWRRAIAAGCGAMCHRERRTCPEHRPRHSRHHGPLWGRRVFKASTTRPTGPHSDRFAGPGWPRVCGSFERCGRPSASRC